MSTLNVRLATEQEIPLVAERMLHAREQLGYGKILPSVTPLALTKWLYTLLTKDATCRVFVAEEDGKVLGHVGAGLSRTFLPPHTLYVSEWAWYVEKGASKRVGVALWKEAVAWGLTMGAKISCYAIPQRGTSERVIIETLKWRG